MTRFKRNAWLRTTVVVLLVLSSDMCAQTKAPSGNARKGRVRIELNVTSPLAYSNTPLDPTIDFPALIRQSGRKGSFDPNSISITSAKTGKAVAYSLSEDFAYGDVGRVEFVANERSFVVGFDVVMRRPPMKSRPYSPAVGIGDLLRFNAGKPRPITLLESMGLHDVTGDGLPDLVGTWNYYYRPGSPSGGVVFYPATSLRHAWQFGDLQRLRYRGNNGRLAHFSRHYNATAFADFNRDGRPDFVYTQSGNKNAVFYLAQSDRDPGGGYRYLQSGSIAVSKHKPCRAVDLNGDGAIDLVINGEYLRNHKQGWPFRAEARTRLDAGDGACFADVDQDGRSDSICLLALGESHTAAKKVVAWRRNLGPADNPRFAAPRRLGGITSDNCTLVATSIVNKRHVLLVQTGFQQIHAYELVSDAPASYQRVARMESASAVMSLSDQAWPCLCDWDDDGDQDLLVGDGYGWPRIVLNVGTRRRPQYAEPRQIMAAGAPIRLIRNQILGPPANWHNMGYSYPDFVDWDGDGLKDLMLPNETNRLHWYRNTGTKGKPQFTKRRQILCDGFADSPDLRSRSQQRANSPKSNNGVYPLEKDRPFFWRTGVAFADFNGDGLMDLVTADGWKRQATLFAQSRQGELNQLKLTRVGPLKLNDGRTIDDRIVKRGNHWGESFRAVDWDGDGRIDLIYSLAGSHHGMKDGGSIYLLRNVGTRTAPVFAPPETMRCFGEPIRITNHGPHPWPGDYDGDGRMDLITCVEWSVYPFYSHAALMMKTRPKYTLRLVD